MFTALDIFGLSMDLISKRSPNGTIDATKTASYRARSLGLLTLWQNIMSRTGDLYSTFEISNSPIPSLYGLITGFDIQEYAKTIPLADLTFETVGQAQSYYFEADGQGTAYIEDYTTQWNILATIVMPTVTNFTAYKGTVTPTNGAIKSRIRFSGPYYYRTLNRALFGIPLDPTKIPDYKPWFKVTMPNDFKSVDTIIDEFPDRQYAKDSTYKWEGRKDLFINYYYVGKVRVVYKPVPIVISDLAQTLQLDEITSMSGAYYLASHLLLIEDPASANFFQQMFEQLRLESNIKQPVSEAKIVDVYGIHSLGTV